MDTGEIIGEYLPQAFGHEFCGTVPVLPALSANAGGYSRIENL
jgi:hypothetical protein